MLQSLLGILAFCAIAWSIGRYSCGPSHTTPWRVVFIGLATQFLFALMLLKVPLLSSALASLNQLVLVLEDATQQGTSMVFGFLGGGAYPFDVTKPENAYILAFRGLPLVLVISAISALLYYWRVLPRVIRALSSFFEKTFGIGSAEGVGVSANIFVGMVESPLLIRPYLNKLSRSELLTLMTCGLATVAGTVMVLYASILADIIDNPLAHILTASLISAPAAIVIAKLMLPETDELTSGDLNYQAEFESATDAISQGTVRGLELLLNIIAMIIVFVALVALANALFSLLPNVANEPLTLQRLFGWLFAPIVWLSGVPWSEAPAAGALLGTKSVLNEFIAYLNLAQLQPEALSERSRVIMTYALCGFANPGSMGIMIGGLSAMAPERRADIAELAWRAFIGGTLATCMTAAVVNVIL